MAGRGHLGVRLAAAGLLAGCMVLARAQPVDLTPVLPPARSIAEARTRIPELAGLTDTQAVKYLHDNYYPDFSLQDLASRLGVTLWHPKKLGPIDAWRYENCLTDAARAPTQYGVVIGRQSCERRFDQVEPQ